MNQPDYFTVMEKRIKYYSAKYDPLNRYLPEEQIPEQIHNHLDQALKRKKNRSVLHNIISIFF